MLSLVEAGRRSGQLSVTLEIVPYSQGSVRWVPSVADQTSLYSQCAPVADLARTVQAFAPAPTMAPATPLTGPASATQVGSAVTAPSVSLAGEQPADLFFYFLFFYVLGLNGGSLM